MGSNGGLLSSHSLSYFRDRPILFSFKQSPFYILKIKSIENLNPSRLIDSPSFHCNVIKKYSYIQYLTKSKYNIAPSLRCIKIYQFIALFLPFKEYPNCTILST